MADDKDILENLIYGPESAVNNPASCSETAMAEAYEHLLGCVGGFTVAYIAHRRQYPDIEGCCRVFGLLAEVVNRASAAVKDHEPKFIWPTPDCNPREKAPFAELTSESEVKIDIEVVYETVVQSAAELLDIVRAESSSLTQSPALRASVFKVHQHAADVFRAAHVIDYTAAGLVLVRDPLPMYSEIYEAVAACSKELQFGQFPLGSKCVNAGEVIKNRCH